MIEVYAIVATSYNGMISVSTGLTPLDWTSKEDKDFFKQVSSQFTHLIVGENTFKTLDEKYFHKTNRNLIVLSKEVENSEFDLSLKTNKINLSLPKLIKQLELKGIRKVLICGGSYVYTQAVKEGVLDYIWQVMSPVYLPTDGVPFLQLDGLYRVYVRERVPLSDDTIAFKLIISKKKEGDFDIGDKLTKRSKTCHVCFDKISISALAPPENKYLLGQEWKSKEELIKEGWIVV